MIKQLKKYKQILQNFEEKTVAEDGTVEWNIPQDLEEFKVLAVDTVNWQIGEKVKKALGNTQTSLSAVNAKAIALLAKLAKPTQARLDKLTDLEKDSWDKLTTLAENGYADSQLLNTSLTKVSEYIGKGTNKIVRITQADSIDAIIDILNENW